MRVVNQKQKIPPCLTYEDTNHEERSETTDKVSQFCHKHEEVGHVFSEMLEKGIEESNKASLIVKLTLHLAHPIIRRLCCVFYSI